MAQIIATENQNKIISSSFFWGGGVGLGVEKFK